MTISSILAFLVSSSGILAFLASLIAIGVSVYQARFARYTSEKWWERKAEAYAKIIEALSDLDYYYDELYCQRQLHLDINDN